MNPIYFSEKGSGYPVVLIHGFCETGRIWDRFADKLSASCRVLLPDLPGFGKSPLPAVPFSIRDIGLRMINWMAGLGLENPVVVGHSLGGYVTLAMVQEQPHLIAGFGLFHSSASADSAEKIENRNKVIDFVNRNGVQPYIDTFVPGLFHQKTNPFVGEVHAIASGTAAETLVAYAAAMRERPSTEKLLSTFTKPVLMIAGEQDTIIPFDVIAEQSRLLKFPFFHGLTNVGHMGMFENEPESIKFVTDFVNLAADFKN